MAAGFLRTEDLPGPQMFDNLSVACSQESPTEGWNRKLGPREGQRSGAGNRFAAVAAARASMRDASRTGRSGQIQDFKRVFRDVSVSRG